MFLFHNLPDKMYLFYILLVLYLFNEQIGWNNLHDRWGDRDVGWFAVCCERRSGGGVRQHSLHQCSTAQADVSASREVASQTTGWYLRIRK